MVGLKPTVESGIPHGELEPNAVKKYRLRLQTFVHLVSISPRATFVGTPAVGDSTSRKLYMPVRALSPSPLPSC